MKPNPHHIPEQTRWCFQAWDRCCTSGLSRQLPCVPAALLWLEWQLGWWPSSGDSHMAATLTPGAPGPQLRHRKKLFPRQIV